MKNGMIPKILMVDDYPNNLIALQAVFSERSYVLIEAHSGEEALSYMLSHSDVSLVLLDVQMPGMDGFETAVKIKTIPAYKDVPIIFITAIFREDPFIKKGYEAGAIDYLSKPFDPAVLLSKVEIYLSHRQKEALLKERETRIQKTEELLTAGRKLSISHEAQPVALMITDEKGNIHSSNQEASPILQSENALDKIDALLKNGAIKNEVLEVVLNNGDKKSINCLATLLKDLDGNISGAAIVIQDMTESKKFEEDLENKILHLLTMNTESTKLEANN